MPETPSFSGSLSTSSSLLDRARAHDPDAWERLVRLYSPLLFHWCRRAGLPADDTADLLQEVFQSVVGALGDFRNDEPQSTFRGWLRTITQNKLRDHFRRRKNRPEAQGGSGQLQLLDIAAVPLGDDTTANELAEKSLLLRQELQLVRAEFEERTWQAFWRVTIHGEQPDVVARTLGISRTAVYIAKSRVLNRLRQVLGDSP